MLSYFMAPDEQTRLIPDGLENAPLTQSFYRRLGQILDMLLSNSILGTVKVHDGPFLEFWTFYHLIILQHLPEFSR